MAVLEAVLQFEAHSRLHKISKVAQEIQAGVLSQKKYLEIYTRKTN